LERVGRGRRAGFGRRRNALSERARRNRRTGSAARHGSMVALIAAHAAQRAGARPARLPGDTLMRVAIIDYGSGNLRSAMKAFERAAREAGIAAEIDLTGDADRVASTDRIVLPGVGAYADCRRGLDAVPGMVEALNEAVKAKGRPFLG